MTHETLTSSPPPVGGAGYAAGPVTKAPPWHGLVAWDTLLNGMTTGLFLVAALGELAAPERFAAVAKPAYPLALGLLLADLVCLVLDLGDPLRFHHMLRVFKPSSPMSLGVWCLSAYALVLTGIVLLDLLAGVGLVWQWVRRVAVVLGLGPALGSAVYKGVLFSTSAQPGWKDARWLGGYFTSSALVMGGAQLLGLAAGLGQEKALAVLRPALGLVVVLAAVPLGLLLADLWPARSRSRGRRQVGLLGAAALGAGALVPVCLLLVTDSPGAMLGAMGCIVLGNLAARFVIVRLPHAL